MATPTTPFRHVYGPDYLKLIEEHEAKRRAEQGPNLVETFSRKFAPGQLMGAGPPDPIATRDPLTGQERGIEGRVSQPSEDFLAMQRENDTRLGEPLAPTPKLPGEYRLPQPPEPTPRAPGQQPLLAEPRPESTIGPLPSSLADRLGQAAGQGAEAGARGVMGPRVAGLGEMPGPVTPPEQSLSPRGQAFEDTITDVPRTENIERLKGIRGIAEGLKQAGRAMTGIHGGAIAPGDDIAHATREELAEAEDKLTAGEVRALQAAGLNLGPETRRSQIKELGLLPALTALKRDEGRFEYGREEGAKERTSREKIAGARSGQQWMQWAMARQERAARESTRVAERKEDQAIRAGERAKQMAMAEEKMGRFSDKELAEVTQLDDAIQGMKSILKEREEQGYATGILDKTAVKLGEMAGVGLSEESLQWRGKVRMQLATWIRDMAGAALGPAEAKYYLDAIPTEWDNEPAFDAKMTSVIDGLEKKRQGFLDTRRWAGKTTEPYETSPFQVPGGGIADVPGGDEEGFMEKYPTAVRLPRGS